MVNSIIGGEGGQQQCCNEDWKWTKDKYEDSLVSEIEKFFEDCKFF